MDDNDMKIFVKRPKDDSVDEVALIAEMNEQRSNGNTEKAKQLGKHLAELFLHEETLHADLESVVGKIDYPKPIIFQIKILMFFTAEYCINRILPSTMLKSTAINVLYDSIMKSASDFYSEFSDGVEYSFYYLAVKKDDITASIGKAFAMVCRKDKEEEFIDLGSRIFTAVANEVEHIIDKYQFVY